MRRQRLKVGGGRRQAQGSRFERAFTVQMSMKTIFCLGLGLLLFCSSCSGRQTEATDVMPAVESESYSDAVDTACSYFYFMWGRAAELEEKFEEAMEAYEKALVCDPGARSIARKLALLLINSGKREQAVVALEQIIAESPDDLDARSLLANLYASMERYDDAVKTYRSILEIEPDDTHSLLLLGSLHAKNRDYNLARKALEHLVAVNPESFMGYSYLAKLYRELRFYDKAFVAYRKALDLNWSSPFAMELAGFYESRKRFADAEDVYLSILEHEEANDEATERLIRLYLHQKKIDEALVELERLRAIREDDERLDLTIGRILLDQKRYEEAAGHFSRVLSENSNAPDAVRTMLALTYYESGKFLQARQALAGIQPESDVFEDSILMRIRILQEEEDLGAAEKLLLEMIAGEETRRKEFYFVLASLYRKQDRPEEGRAVFSQAEKAFPDNAKVVFEHALFLDRLGEMDEAIVLMEKVLLLDPDEPYALNYVGYTWADREMNLEKALEYVSRAVSLKPEDGYVQDSLGWVYFKMGDFSRAVEELEKAVALQADDPTINEHLGDAYLKNGDRQRALDSYRKAAELYQDKDKKEQVMVKIRGISKRDSE